MSLFIERAITRNSKPLATSTGSLAVTDPYYPLHSHYHIYHVDALGNLHEQARVLGIDQSVKFCSLEEKLKAIYEAIQRKTEDNYIARKPEGESMLSDDMEGVRNQLADLDLMGREVSRFQNMMKSLAFKQRVERYCSIPIAHQTTLQWIFDPGNTSETSSEAKRLHEWLRGGQGLFWVSGKPGSGKSTLMKFLANSPQTRAALADWGGVRKVVVASHYFWWSGTALQKSQEGLLRSLLYDIFKEGGPDLIQYVCPERWKSLDNISDDTGGEPGSNWSLQELGLIFESLANIDDMPVSFCMFIDGLDEYGARGELDGLCNLLKRVSTSSKYVKFCISSRPWNEFLVAFGHLQEDQTIHVHDMTEQDIRNYAHARLAEHEYWKTLSEMDGQTESLLDLLSKQAKGVFLWVFLVTTSLKESLNNRDSLSDLHRRLQSYPTNLNSFFKDMLESVDSWYYQKMSSCLQIALTSEEPLNAIIYAFHEKEFEDADYAFSLPVGPTAHSLDLITARLNGWCKGLLEVHDHDNSVQFLHRTVKDFLMHGEMVGFLKEKGPEDSCPGLSIVKSYTAWIKTSKFHNVPDVVTEIDNISGTRGRPWQFGEDIHDLTWTLKGLLHAVTELETSEASQSTQDDVALHIDEVAEAMSSMQYLGDIQFENADLVEGSNDVSHLLRFYVLEAGLASYLNRKLSRQPDYLGILSAPALSILLDAGLRHRDERVKNTFPRKYYSCLECLLKNGEEPRQAFEKLMEFAIPSKQSAQDGETEIELSPWTLPIIHSRIMSLFLTFGAVVSAQHYKSMLLLSFQIPAIPSDEDSYLSELDFFSRCYIPRDHLVHQIYLSRLEDLSSKETLNARVTVEVLSRLLRVMGDEGEEVTREIWDRIKECLSSRVCKRIELACNTVDGGSSLSDTVGMKRKGIETQNDTCNAKVAKKG